MKDSSGLHVLTRKKPVAWIDPAQYYLLLRPGECFEVVSTFSTRLASFSRGRSTNEAGSWWRPCHIDQKLHLVLQCTEKYSHAFRVLRSCMCPLDSCMRMWSLRTVINRALRVLDCLAFVDWLFYNDPHFGLRIQVLSRTDTYGHWANLNVCADCRWFRA